jgi:hypothetical protein
MAKGTPDKGIELHLDRVEELIAKVKGRIRLWQALAVLGWSIAAFFAWELRSKSTPRRP